MLARNITTSRKVNRLSDDFSPLLYTWLIPFADDFGRMEGDAVSIKAKIIPMRPQDEKDIEKALSELVRADLIFLYFHQGERYLEIKNFDAFQTFKNDRTRKAEYPVPSESDGIQSIPLSVEEKRSKDKVREEKRREGVQGGDVASAPPTPKEKAISFFSGIESLKKGEDVPWLREFLVAIAENSKAEKPAVWSEVTKFTTYWTELNATGKKQRWELQRTFEVEKRLVTWFKRAGFNEFSTIRGVRPNRGKAIIGLTN